MGRSFPWRICLVSLLMGLALWALPQSKVHAQASTFDEGLNFFQGGHYRWALEKFVQAVDQAPRDPRRRWYLAEAYRHLGDTDAATYIYRQILQMAPQSPEAAAARRALDALSEPTVASFQVPFRTRGSSVLVPAKVNGQPVGFFILDTGATFTSVSRQVADTLGISRRDGSVRLITASGVIQAPLALLEEVEVGGAVARHVPAVIHDLPDTPPSIIGLLGLSFLQRFRVHLDLTSGVLILETGR